MSVNAFTGTGRCCLVIALALVVACEAPTRSDEPEGRAKECVNPEDADPLPGAPTGLQVIRDGVKLTAAWAAVPGATGYQGVVEFYSQGAWHEWGLNIAGGGFSAAVPRFRWTNYPSTSAEAYSFRVKVRALVGSDWTAYSPWAYECVE